MDIIKTVINSRLQDLRKSQDLAATGLPVKKQRPINLVWEEASEFGQYVRLSTPFVMKLFKIYGKNEVLSLRSYLKDSQCATSMYAGMVINRLKGLKK